MGTRLMAMESVKAYIIGWLDWGANYVKEDPEDFFSKCERCYFPLVNWSRIDANIIIAYAHVCTFISGKRQTILG